MYRILVAEDSPTQAEQLRSDLEISGFEAVVARDGQAALTEFEKGDFDMIVSDIVMPEIDGYELCARIKATPRGRGTPVMLLSTLADPMDIVRGLECGADNFITKPYVLPQLLSRIETIRANQELRSLTKIDFGVEVVFLGKKIKVTSEKEQILDLLISTFEDIVRTNYSLQASKVELALAKEELDAYAKLLETRVAERTKSLAERTRQLAWAQKAAHLGSWRWDVDTGKMDWSDEMYRIFGVDHESYDPSLDLGLSRIHPDDREKVDRDQKHAVAEKRSSTVEFRVVHPSGETRYFWSDYHCELNSTGEVRSVLGITQDITRRRQAELDLREAERRFVNIVEATKVVTYAWDISTRKYLYMSPSIVNLTGSTSEEWIDSDYWLSMIHPEDRDQKLEDLTEYLASPRNAEFDYRIVTKDGRVIWVRDIVRVDTREGSVSGLLFDVTETKNRDVQLAQAQKMEAVGQLTGGLAHDFNNLLGIIIGNLDLLKEANTDPQVAELTDTAIRAGLRGAELTRQLLAFSRRQPLAARLIDLNESIAELLVLLRGTLGEDITVVAIPSTAPAVSKIDAAQFETAILNLAVNARHAMPNGGQLTIETKFVTLDDAYVGQNTEVDSGDYVVVEVSDTGTGMSKEILDRVFEPFFTTKEVGSGTGLGLSMVYGFVKQSGGHIKIYSEVGHGTTIRIYLRREQAELVAEVEPNLTEESEPAYGTILVVEDDAELQKTVVRILTKGGYRVYTANNGAEALDLLKSGEAIDVLFTDIVMPGKMTGYELANSAREVKPKLKVIYTSGFNAASLRGNGNLSGNDKLLSKPYRYSDLTKAIAEILKDDKR